jgi:conjugal transfer pilus assembly protein TrbC
MIKEQCMKKLGFLVLCLMGLTSAFAEDAIEEARRAMQNAGEILAQENIIDETDLDCQVSKVNEDDLQWMQQMSKNLQQTGFALTQNPTLSEDPVLAADELTKRAGRGVGQSRETDLFIFASFSMPPKSLQRLALDAHHKGATVVMQGFINNSPAQTVLKTREVFKEHGANLSIDPERFTQFKVIQVPAIVLAPKGQAYKPVTHDIIYGDISIDYALARFADRGDLSAQAKARL